MRVALVLRFGGRFAFADEYDYDSIATALVHGKGFSLDGAPSAFRPPGQVLFLAAIYGIAGHRPLVAELIQAVLLSLVPLAVLAIARRSTSRPFVPEIAAAVAAVHPGIAYASATLYPVALTAAALALGVWGATEVASRGGVRRACLTGLALGAAGAATPYFVPLPVLAGWAVRRRAGTRAALALALAGLLPAAAWTARNAVVLGVPTLGTNAGVNLFLGANDLATVRSGNWVEPLPLDASASRSEVARDAAWSKAGRKWIAEHPGRWAVLSLGRAVAVLDSVGRPRTSGVHQQRWAVLIGWAMLPWVVAGLVGLWSRRSDPAARIVGFAFVLVVAASALTITKPRFRFPLDPLLAIFAVEILYRVLCAAGDRWRSWHPSPAA